MNILPKKNWHVRTKDNIARVRRDEAAAAEAAKEVERRALLAEQEARTSLLRARARERLGYSEDGPQELVDAPTAEGPAGPEDETLIGPPPPGDVVPVDVGVTDARGHVNFFMDLEEGQQTATANKEHEEEKKKEQEEYEKKVGYLTYLGQDTEELTGDKVWWKTLPVNRSSVVAEERGKSMVAGKQKDFLDPLNDVRKYLGCEGVQLTIKRHEKKIEKTEQKALGLDVKKEKRKRKRSSSSESTERRHKSKKKKRDYSSDERHVNKKSSKKKKKVKRSKKSRKRKYSSSSDSESERRDRAKQKANLEKLREERLKREHQERARTEKLLYGEPEKEKPKNAAPEKIQKYNSQFNPDAARQNKLDPNKKYWLD